MLVIYLRLNAEYELVRYLSSRVSSSEQNQRDVMYSKNKQLIIE